MLSVIMEICLGHLKMQLNFTFFFNRCLWLLLCLWHHLASLCVQGHIISQYAPLHIFQSAVVKPHGHFQPAMSHYQHATCSTSLPAVSHRYPFLIIRSHPFLLILMVLPIIYLVSNMCLHPPHNLQLITISHITTNNIISHFIR